MDIFKSIGETSEYKEKRYKRNPPSNCFKSVWFDVIDHFRKNSNMKNFFSDKFM